MDLEQLHAQLMDKDPQDNDSSAKTITICCRLVNKLAAAPTGPETVSWDNSCVPSFAYPTLTLLARLRCRWIKSRRYSSRARP